MLDLSSIPAITPTAFVHWQLLLVAAILPYFRV
jgi:hypothetical protein